MKFRTKLLILLLMATLLPLGLSFVAQQISMRYYGNKLAQDMKSLLQGNAQTLLQTLTTDYGQVLTRDKAIAEMALRVQTQAVESRLSSDPPQNPPPIYYAPDFQSENHQPPDLTPCSRHQRLTEEGNLAPIPVSYTCQVVFLPQGVKREDVRDQILRLSTMSQVYRSLQEIQPDLFLWQYTTLESGVHTSYPGKGVFPADYDPRERLWYQEAMDAKEPIQLIMTDVSTGALIFTLAAPVFTAEGSPAGVTALDIDYRQFFADWQIPEKWADSADCMVMVYHQEHRREVNRKLEILLHNRSQDRVRNWRIPVEKRFLDLPKSQLLQILEDVRAGRSGVHTLSYQGEQSLMAYGSRTKDEPFPVVIVPTSKIMAQAVSTESFINDQIDMGLAIGAILTIAAVSLAVFMAVVRSRQVTEPVMQLATAADQLAKGNFESRVHINYCQELNELGKTFNSLSQGLKEREEMKQSLELARIIQQRLLPDQAPPCPGFELAGRSEYCQETGGDYYDFIFLGEDSQHRPALALGDVSGHGIGTALVMATARAMLHALAVRHGRNLQDLFAELNASLCRDTEDTYFMTLFYGLLDCQTSTLNWISAGHAPLFLYRRSGCVEQLDSSGIPLGVMAQSSFETPPPLVFSPGDILLICSDGVWECNDPQGEMFGIPRVEQLLQDLANRDAAGICDGFLDVLARFRNGEQRKDDITLLVIKATE